jgi:tRNA (cmo5U34)-methyltransferase
MSADNHTPHADGRWAFDASVTDNFDAMLSHSIPEYQSMRDLTYYLGRNFTHLKGNVVDIGASRGEALAPFIKDNAYMCTYHALEISEPMLEVLRSRFDPSLKVGVHATDLRKITNESPALGANESCLILSILTIQFTPIEYRSRILRTLYRALKPGGCLLFVEKILGNTPDIDELLVREYYEMKNRNGYSYEDIERKKSSLEGVLVPMTDSWNREMLRSAGFDQVDCYYRSMNFAGYVAIKDR